MTWWLPTTWGEDFGAADRISFYEFRRVPADVNGGGLYYLALKCRLKIPDGRIVNKITRTDKTYFRGLYDVSAVKSELREKMQRQTRERYPEG